MPRRAFFVSPVSEATATAWVAMFRAACTSRSIGPYPHAGQANTRCFSGSLVLAPHWQHCWLEGNHRSQIARVDPYQRVL